MKMNYKISVIVPIYNAEHFVERCAGSILKQTHQNIELILVNDGSEDGSLESCRKIAARDKRVVVLDKKNGGAASARNLGLDYATGDYIGFCDVDDFFDVRNLYVFGKFGAFRCAQNSHAAAVVKREAVDVFNRYSVPVLNEVDY